MIMNILMMLLREFEMGQRKEGTHTFFCQNRPQKFINLHLAEFLPSKALSNLSAHECLTRFEANKGLTVNSNNLQ
jgi:hypothetical protein